MMITATATEVQNNFGKYLGMLQEVGKITGYISAWSVPNIVYIMRKELDAERIRNVLEKLSLIFQIADLRAGDLKRAADMAFKDYEDAVQSACAARINADYIITRNEKDYLDK